MKTLAITLCTIASALGLATAQTVSETTTVTPIQSAGTITTFDPTGSSLIISGPNATPVTYAYSKSTLVVDEAGNPMAADVVKSGLPVTVYYTSVNGQMVASKIMVQKVAPAAQQTTTTTTTVEEKE